MKIFLERSFGQLTLNIIRAFCEYKIMIEHASLILVEHFLSPFGISIKETRGNTRKWPVDSANVFIMAFDH